MVVGTGAWPLANHGISLRIYNCPIDFEIQQLLVTMQLSAHQRSGASIREGEGGREREREKERETVEQVLVVYWGKRER